MSRAQNQKKSAGKRAQPAPAVSRDEIAREAFKIFQARHGAPGDPVADWFEAERVVAARVSTTRPIEAQAAAAASLRGGNGKRLKGKSRRR